MNLVFLYASIVTVAIAFILILLYKPLSLASIIIGITSIAYSLIFDIVFGDFFKLYHYISRQSSTIYMVLSAVFIYSLLNIIYTIYLPKKGNKVLIYTVLWIISMLIFEYFSVYFKTIIFTGWRVIPWSIITYIATYFWIYLFYRYLIDKGLDKILIINKDKEQS